MATTLVGLATRIAVEICAYTSVWDRFMDVVNEYLKEEGTK